jgi:hypothetical protein
MRDRPPIILARRFDLVALLGASVLCLTGCTQEGRDRPPFPGNPVPEIASLSPEFALAGQASFMLTVRGENFDADSVVRWNGTDRITHLVNIEFTEIALNALIDADDVADPGTAEITVFNPLPGGGESNAVTFTVHDPDEQNPDPTIVSVSPTTVDSGGPNVDLIVNGTGFISDSQIFWRPALGGSPFAAETTFVSSTRLTATIPASEIGPPGGAQVTVVNPAPGGGTSNPVTVAVQ